MKGLEFKKRRKELGLTQGEIAKLLGVAMNTVARWERDEVPIVHPEMIRLALKALACKQCSKS